MTKAEPEKTGLKAGTRDRGLQDATGDDRIPEGLLRLRTTRTQGVGEQHQKLRMPSRIEILPRRRRESFSAN